MEELLKKLKEYTIKHGMDDDNIHLEIHLDGSGAVWYMGDENFEFDNLEQLNNRLR